MNNRNRNLQYRIAVVIFFFVNGFLYANCTGRLPELKDYFGVSNSTLGTMLFTTAIGALVAMPLTGWLTTRYNSGKLTIYAGFLFCCIVPFIPYSQNIWVGRLSFFLTGFFSGAMDITMNGQAVFVERKYKKTIMSSFHAAYSIGMALGAGSGSIFANYHYPLRYHLLYVAIGGIIALAIVSPVILQQQAGNTTAAVEKGDGKQRVPLLIWLIAVIGFCGMTGEGSIVDWSAIYMHTVVGKTKAFSALAVGSFATAMTIGRLFGDRLIDKAGKQTILFCSCFAAIAGLAIVLLFVSASAVLLGFFLVGIGLSNVVPLTYSTAGNIKGIEPAAGIAIASTIGYSGFFIGPPAIGYLADGFGLRVGLCFTLGLFLIMLGMITYITRGQNSRTISV
ncbi:MAG: MFS transporter [Chitinophagaceae bacterium]|nr:MFS transporter [Chitinophagaceae bacterium]